MSLLHIFLWLPCPGANTHPWKALGGSWALRNTPFNMSPMSFKLLLRAMQRHPAGPLCPTRIWILGCTQDGLNGVILLHSHYFLNLVCELHKSWVVVTLQKSPPSVKHWRRQASFQSRALRTRASYSPEPSVALHLERVQKSNAFLCFLTEVHVLYFWYKFLDPKWSCSCLGCHITNRNLDNFPVPVNAWPHQQCSTYTSQPIPKCQLNSAFSFQTSWLCNPSQSYIF